jgi:hypothetical protein
MAVSGAVGFGGGTDVRWRVIVNKREPSPRALSHKRREGVCENEVVARLRERGKGRRWIMRL